MAHTVDAAVELGSVVDHEHNQVEPPVPVEIGDGDACSLGVLREPVRDLDPRRPARADVAVGAEIAANAIGAAVGLRSTVDGQHDKVGRPAASHVTNSDRGPLISWGKPVRHCPETSGNH